MTKNGVKIPKELNLSSLEKRREWRHVRDKILSVIDRDVTNRCLKVAIKYKYTFVKIRI